MDYSKFLDEDFDVKEWVNSAFRSQQEGTKDQHATTLVMKLQMFIQEVNNVIEDSCQQTITNLPRVLRELEAVRQEASLLQDQMKVIKHDIQKVEYDTAQSMQMLLELDAIKSRMQAASGALQEADNWTTLSCDVDEVFESGDISAISYKLVGMQQSLNMLTDVPDFAERCQFLETLKNRLEAMLSTEVVTAFSSTTCESAQRYVKIFSDIDRLQQLSKYYHKCKMAPLLDDWRRIQSEESEKSLPERLTEFYDLLLSVFHSQIQWCNQVFPEPVPVVCSLVTEALSCLDPSLTACLAAHLQHEPEPLPALISLKQASQRFATNLANAIAAQPSGSTYAAYSRGLATCIYLPYKPYMRLYGEYEKRALTSTLDNIALDAEDVHDTVTLLAESVPKLFTAAMQANERCTQLTNGCGYLALLKAIQSYIDSYQKEFRRVLVNLTEKCNLDEASVDSEDWDLFQNALRLVQVCGEMLLQCEELDHQLGSSIANTVGKLCATTLDKNEPTRNAFEEYKTLLLDSHDERRGLDALFTRLQEGDSLTVLVDTMPNLYELCQMVHKFAFDIAIAPIERQISVVADMEIWTSGSGKDAMTSDLPTFSLTPQEYITKIGNYLLMVPQQLETFSLDDDPALLIAVKYSKLPFHSQSEVPEQLADLWLEAVCAGTAHHYSEHILRIPNLSPHATKQLLTDINYLTTVVEDLGLAVSATLTQIVQLLRSGEDELEVSDSTPQRLVSAIASMRNMTL